MNNKLHKLILGALIAALCCICTMAVTIPTPTGGYVHAGDAFVILGGMLLGPIYGGIAGGIGSMLSDLLLGYSFYAPATFIIKFCAAFTVGLIFKTTHRKSTSFITLIVCGISSSLIVIVGYFLFELALTDNALSSIFSSVIGNAFQGIMSTALSIPIIKLIPAQFKQLES